ncbi:hypothetical protein M409DRAFT_38197 [Zasmidium cellare ATCC 36951]|uniref:malate dehydrogenase n=1 Tax=Zasmidium cellare ATCC 36951 TaxID=1080233 RepID=A0A6A6BY88_ZASCE|nr:uncharacterized protein M409DRAFT_38197 [Zasmidium cellare ATCC 36951]KAF2158522.1 hypothetical protein M409DRAFT_38197 [Zasmidium cellare ATCC 36951]
MAKVAVLGASGQIGQPLSLLLKMSNLVNDLFLYDVVHSVGVGVDLNQIDTPGKVQGFLPADNGLEQALAGAEVVVIPAGIARKPGMTRDDLFKTNAGVIKTLITAVATTCPKAYVCVITNPVNSTLPIAVEVLKQHGVFDARKVFGVTTLDVVRGSTFVAQELGDPNPKNYVVPLLGGHSGATILPLYSQCQPKVQLSQEQLERITYRVQFGGDEIVKAKAGAGSATTCMAYAGFRFIESILRARNGENGVVEAAYVYLPGIEGGQAVADRLQVDYFSTKLDFSKEGAVRAHSIGPLSEYEEKLLAAGLPELKVNISNGTAAATAKI